MPTFHYTAKRGPEDVVEGVLEADNRGGVLIYLAEQGYVPLRISEQTLERAVRAPAVVRPVRIRRVPTSRLVVLTRQFASLVRSYVPLLRALNILEQQAKHPSLRMVLHQLAEDVRQGQTLSAGLAKFPQIFPLLYVNLIRCGESTGALDVILERLAQQMDEEEQLRARIRMALTYPVFVGLVGCGTILFLMTFVIPRLSRLLIGLGDRLPWPTRALLAISSGLRSGWCWLGLAIMGCAIGFVWAGFGERGRLVWDRCVLRLPVVGGLIEQAEVARFARSFGLQILHGIPILQAVEIAISVVNHRVIRAQLSRVPEGLRQGEALSTCLKPLAIGTPFLVNTVAVGEESGKVGEAMTEVATYYERDSERLVQTLMTLLEPTLIVVIGLIVGFIVMAVLLPIFEMSSVKL